MHAKHRTFVTASALTIAIAAFAPLVQAQEETPDDDNRRLGTITVTAQRVEQNIQQVPISVTAIGGDALEARQIDGFDQLQYVAPGVTFNSGVNARQSATTIRGIGTGLFNIGIEGSVAIAVDGVIMGREGAGIFDFADVERVEVLRGPQGTLFGKNASAGVISVVTKKPTEGFTAEMNLGYGSYDEVNAYGAISGPIVDGVTARLSAYSNTRDGYIKNVNPNSPQGRVNERNEQGVRGKVNFALSDTSDLLLSADYVTRDQAAGALTYRQASAGGPGTGLLGFGVPAIRNQSAALGIVPGPDNLSIGSEVPFSSEMDAWGLSAEYSRSLGNFEFVSLTSHREWNSVDNNDSDLTPLPILEINSGDLGQNQFSQEFRLVSPRDKAFTYTLGAYYFTQDIDQNNIQAGTAGLNLLGALPAGARVGTRLESEFSETNYAVFGQGEYAVTDKLSLIGGLRVLNSEVEGSQEKFAAAGAVAPFAGQVVSNGVQSASDEDTALVWRLGAQYFVNDDTNLFATVTRGYKSAGIVQGLTINPVSGTTLPTVEAEIPTQFEAGIRRSSVDRRLVTNFTGFYGQIEDFQAQTLVPGPSGTSIFTVANAGKAETYGFESEITALPTENLTLSAAIAYTNATFDEFTGAPCYQLQTPAQGCSGTPASQDLSGKRLPNSPEWVVNALARYDFDLTAQNAAFVQLGAQYRSDTMSGLANDPNTVIDAYTLLDMQVGVNFWDDRATFTVFGRNLTDENFAEAIVAMPFDTGGYAQFVTLEAQRTWGAKLSLRY
ncbi:TonB-dependent receptor [Hyphomonas neptunium ATCC 15444]|uniref:TonB-dependent receptor n=2 Tax=Hyphomonas TaxID=85 RepID=Q0BZF0_HYPNA|nr:MULTISPECIES: TonB-dependent receptor [Hyphomonas]ABI75744.1 TonB-dependent receptor [Hyphomonas neptunium ATCC 15444]KCZ95232.1 TonB-dependent receptor [Hyphomonas hirschiana VP5]